MSAAVKSEEASESEKEMVADSPAFRNVLSLAIAMVGRTVSIATGISFIGD
jgi:ABC-type cobalamin transport system permease subunit